MASLVSCSTHNFKIITTFEMIFFLEFVTKHSVMNIQFLFRKFICKLCDVMKKQASYYLDLQGVPKKISLQPMFEFLTLGGVFLGVKNKSEGCLQKKNSIWRDIVSIRGGGGKKNL